MKGQHPLWELRTKDEASTFWREEFGHLSSDQQQQEADGATEVRHASKATLV